jgi:DNA polymerase-3 subunit delta'
MTDANASRDREIFPWTQVHWVFFQKRLQAARLAHAILVGGPPGAGKLALARAMAERLLCRESFEYACGECRSCQLLSGGAHPDFSMLQPDEGKKVIRVDQVRELIGRLDLTTSISARKVALIHPAESMNREAANALLKSLEEPAGDTVLILVSDNPGKLPVTIRSRCQMISVALPEQGEALEWLQASSEQPRAGVRSALLAAGGSPLLARRYLDSPLTEGYTQVQEVLLEVLRHPASVSVYAAQLNDWDPAELWRWLSMCTADWVKKRMLGDSAAGLPLNLALDEKNLLELQQQADINRQLTASSVRADLLLHDWMIKWAELVL